MQSAMKQAVSELCVPVPWGEIRGKVWGPDHGRPVLCLHGWSDNCGSFDTLIPLLPKEYRYVAVDLPGHGKSSHLPLGTFYTFPAYVADVRRVVDDLHWTKFSIIGHSMGGNIGAMFSALYPERVDTLILLDVYGLIPTDLRDVSIVMRQGIDKMIQFENHMREGEKRVYTYEKAVARLLTANPTLSEQAVHILLERGLKTVEGGFVFSRDIRVTFENIVRTTLEQCAEMWPPGPLLIILGDKGVSVEPKWQRFIPIILQGHHDRNTPVVTVSGDHHVHLNNPQLVAPFICDFLQTKRLSH